MIPIIFVIDTFEIEWGVVFAREGDKCSNSFLLLSPFEHYGVWEKERNDRRADTFPRVLADASEGVWGLFSSPSFPPPERVVGGCEASGAQLGP